MEFEKKVKRLENIVEKMQTEDLSLEDSFKLFEEGINLSKECNKKLSEVENKVKILVGSDKNAKTEDFKPA